MCEGGNTEVMLVRAQSMINSGINFIVLLALSDDGKPWHDEQNTYALAAMGAPVFACTPDQFPDLIAVTLQKGDVANWVGQAGIVAVR